MDVAALIGWTAVAFTVAQFWPQPIRSWKMGVAGVSGATWGMLLISVSTWTGAGIAEQEPVVWVTNLLVAPGVLLVCWLLRKTNVLYWAGFGSIVAFLCALQWPWVALVVVSIWEVAAIFPQVREAYSSTTRTALAGVSVAGWTTTIVAQTLWFIWWATAGKAFAPAFGALTIAVMAGAIVVRVLYVRKRVPEHTQA